MIQLSRAFGWVLLLALAGNTAHTQSADWTEVIWREPQVRYLLADMTGSGKTDLYRKYATEERDPDSREAGGQAPGVGHPPGRPGSPAARTVALSNGH